jgi:2-keto-3-deoxy-L-rhamnonate aldolase RhmA
MYPLLSKLADGRTAFGILNKGGPNLVRHLASAGLDFVIGDMMHSAMDWHEAGYLCAMARADQLFPFIRLQAHPWGSGAHQVDRRFQVDAAKAFALGAQGIIWSITGAEEARSVAHLSSDWHQGKPVTTTAELHAVKAEAQKSRLLIPLIESQGALDELDDIAATPGIAGVFIGCTDLAQVLGHPHDYLHGDVLGAIRRAVEITSKHGKIVLVNTGYTFSTVPGQIEHARILIDLGVRMIMLQSCEFYLYFSTKSVLDGVAGRG